MITALKKTTTILGGENFPLCESPSLRLHKYVNLEKNKKDKEKGKELEAVVSCMSRNPEPIQVLTPPRAKTLVAKLGARLLVNMSGGILENANCALHRNLGYPVIPGSAVKGVARHVAWCEWNECEDIQEKDALAARIATVFGYPTGEKNLDNALKALGTPESQGKIAFLTAVPDEKAELEVDILTSHHQEYYGGKKTKATDDEEPIPVPFLAISRESKFIFTLVPLRTADAAAMQDAIGWVKSAITLHGIGAKTATGYGWFLDSFEEDLSEIVEDEDFLEELNQTYGKVNEKFKKTYKKGEIILDTDGKKKAFCLFLNQNNAKIGGQWQDEIDGWMRQYGVK